MPNTQFPWARSEDFSNFREHRLIYDVEAGAKKGEVEAKAKEGGEAVPGPERFGKMADARRKSAEGNVKGASDGVRTATERAGKELSNFFDDLNRPVTLSEDAQKNAGNILRSYDAQTNYSREETIARLQVLGFQFTTDGPNNEFDRAVQNAKSEPPGTVVPPLRAGSTISKISGAFGLFNTMLQRHVRDRSGNNSERGKFVNGVEDFNRSNRNTASLMINQRAASGTTPAAEDLSVTLLQTGAVTTKEMQERRKGLAAQLRTSSMISEADMKAREADSNIFVIKDITPAKFRQVQNAINAIRDSRDAAPPPSSNTSNGPSGGPSSGPGANPNTPAPTERQKAESEAKALLAPLEVRLQQLPPNHPTRKTISEQIAILRNTLSDSTVTPDTIVKNTAALRKLDEELTKALETTDKNLKSAQQRGTKAIEGSQPLMKILDADPRLVRLKNLVQGQTQIITKAMEGTDITAIDKAITDLNETVTRVNDLLPVLEESEKAVQSAETALKTRASDIPAETAKTVRERINAVEKGRIANDASPQSVRPLTEALTKEVDGIDKAIKNAQETKKKTEEAQKLRDEGQVELKLAEPVLKTSDLPEHVQKELKSRIATLRTETESTTPSPEPVRKAIAAVAEMRQAVNNSFVTRYTAARTALTSADSLGDRADANDPISSAANKRLTAAVGELRTAMAGFDPSLIETKTTEVNTRITRLEEACKDTRREWGHNYLRTNVNATDEGNNRYSKQMGFIIGDFMGMKWKPETGKWGDNWWDGGRETTYPFYDSDNSSRGAYGYAPYDTISRRLKEINADHRKPPASGL